MIKNFLLEKLKIIEMGQGCVREFNTNKFFWILFFIGHCNSKFFATICTCHKNRVAVIDKFSTCLYSNGIDVCANYLALDESFSTDALSHVPNL